VAGHPAPVDEGLAIQRAPVGETITTAKRSLRVAVLRRTLAAAAALTALAGAVATPQASAAIRAGAASADLTPPIGTPMFAYTARSNIASPDNGPALALQLVADPDSGGYATTFVPSRGIHTRVRARAIVLQTEAGKFALVQADLGGLPYDLTRAVLDRIADTGLTADHVLISATHTHSSTGPIWPGGSQGYALLGGDLFDPRVFELTADGIAEAILAADKRLAPARVGVATTQLHGASRNRNFDPFGRNPDVPKDTEARKAVSINPALTVIRVDGTDRRPIGVWSNFAVHNTSFGDDNLLFSGDNASFTERIVERAIRRAGKRRKRAPRGPVVDVWTNSAEGDVSPNGGADLVNDDEKDPLQYVPNSFAGAHMAGKRVAAGMLRAWRKAGRRMRSTIALDSRQIFLQFDGTPADGEPVGPVAVLGAGIVQEGLCAPADNLAGPGQGMKFPGLEGAGLVPDTAPLSVWRVGSLALGAFSTEITTQMGRRITAAMLAGGKGVMRRATIVGLTNAYQSYTATPEEYDACAYEGSFTLWGRRQGPRLRDVAVALTRALVGGESPPSAAPPPALALPQDPNQEPGQTPDAGTPEKQPEPVVPRLGRATFSWHGGNPQVDAPRGETLVSLQRRKGKRFVTVATDDTYADIVERDDQDVWTETYQFGECARPGTYRFRVTGRADRGEGPAPYTLDSNPFRVQRLRTLTVEPAVVQGRRATLRALYPDPGKQALLALPRRVVSGRALLKAGRRKVRARPTKLGVFRARVPKGAQVKLLSLRDRCGNTGGA
jgi:neutral ceramidase